MTRAPANAVDPDWLALRGPADVHARTTFASDQATALGEHLARRLPDGSAVARLVDVGAGAGAGARWLRDRLPMRQDWRLLDHDPRILATAAPTVEGWARNVVAGVDELPLVLAHEPAHVVTCQALLDVLTAEQVETLLAPAVAARACLLLSLSVTGEVRFSPPHPDDGLVAEAFDGHQRRAGRLGPDGGAYAADVLRGHGYAVAVAATPWCLGATEHALVRAWLRGRAAAALEQEPDHADQIGRWQQSREAAAVRGELSAVVGHVDVLGLPSGPVVSA